MRTCELIALRASDVIIRGPGVAKTTILLHQVKNNREHVVELPPNSPGELALAWLLKFSNSGLLFQENYASVNRMLKTFEAEHHLSLNLTPHSLRAGGATALKLAGKSVVFIMEQGRWASLDTVRGYLDVLFLRMPPVRRQIQNFVELRLRDVPMFLKAF